MAGEREAAEIVGAATVAVLDAAAIGHEEPQVEAMLGGRIGLGPLRHRENIDTGQTKDPKSRRVHSAPADQTHPVARATLALRGKACNLGRGARTASFIFRGAVALAAQVGQMVRRLPLCDQDIICPSPRPSKARLFPRR